MRSYISVASDHYAPRNSFDAFFPFIVAAANPQDGLVYAPHQIAVQLRALGWAVGGDFVELFTKGLVDRGLVSHPDNSGVRRWTGSAASADASEAERDIDHLKEAFFAFSENLSGLLLHNLSADDRLHELAKALASHRLFSVDALHAYAELHKDDEASSTDERGVNRHDFEFLCARFIQHAHRNDQRSFNALLGLANIGIVTNLTTFFHSRSDNLERTGSPTLILDAPLLIDYVGLNGEVRRADAAIIIDSAKQRGSKIWAFKHSIAEANDIVTAVSLAHPRDRFGPLAAALRAGEVTREALEEFRRDPFGVVDRMNVVDQIFDVRGRHKWQEEDFREDDWQAVYSKLTEWTEPARSRDCDSIMGVMRLRGGKATRSPWEAKYFLLTSNPALAEWAKKACVEQDLFDATDVGPAISRHEFAAILWLAGDANNKLEVASTHLLAAAQALLARDKGLIEKVQEYASRLESNRKELVDAIIQTELSYELLQDLTLGNPARVSEDSFARVIESLVERGRIAGAEEAQAAEKKTTRRLKAEAASAKLAMEASAQAAIASSALAEVAEKARIEAEVRAKAAELQATVADSERQALEAKAQSYLVAAQAAREALAGRIAGDEADWSNIAATSVRVLQSSAFLALGMLAIAITWLGWLLKNATGASVSAALIALLALVIVLNDQLKSNYKSWIAKKSDALARRLLARPVRRFERRVGIPAGFANIAVTEGRVSLTNRDAIFEHIERAAPSEPKG